MTGEIRGQMAAGDKQGSAWRRTAKPVDSLAGTGGVRKGAQSRQCGFELVLPGPALGKVQSEAARLAGEPSGEGEEALSEGLGGCHRLAQTGARGPAGEVVGHDPVSSTGQALDGQPGDVGWEATGGEMVEPHAVLETADGVLDLGAVGSGH